MFRRLIALFVCLCFCFSNLQYSQAQDFSINQLPVPGTMVLVSPAFEPALIKGLTVHKDNPFLFDFIVDPGQSHLSPEDFKEESDRMVKYFFASLTIPDQDIWVNLSPYEKDRMIPSSLGVTAMGRDLLAQDYMLKQLTASLIYPQQALGKTFWARVYAKAKEMYGTTQVPVNTFNKVWIVPQRVGIYEHGQTAFIVDGHLKVMLEEDYLSLQKHSNVGAGSKAALIRDGLEPSPTEAHSVASQIIRQIILPEIEKEVNDDKNFATLRQIFYAQALAVWFKRNLKQALLNRVYTNRSTVKGIDQNNPATNEAIYQQYLRAYKKGVFNYIKEDIDPVTQETLPRKYFSGGYTMGNVRLTPAMITVQEERQVAQHDIDETVAVESSKAMAAALARNVAQVDTAMSAQELVDSMSSEQRQEFMRILRGMENLQRTPSPFLSISLLGNRLQGLTIFTKTPRIGKEVAEILNRYLTAQGMDILSNSHEKDFRSFRNKLGKKIQENKLIYEPKLSAAIKDFLSEFKTVNFEIIAVQPQSGAAVRVGAAEMQSAVGDIVNLVNKKKITNDQVSDSLHERLNQLRDTPAKRFIALYLAGLAVSKEDKDWYQANWPENMVKFFGLDAAMLNEKELRGRISAIDFILENLPKGMMKVTPTVGAATHNDDAIRRAADIAGKAFKLSDTGKFIVKRFAGGKMPALVADAELAKLLPRETSLYQDTDPLFGALKSQRILDSAWLTARYDLDEESFYSLYHLPGAIDGPMGKSFKNSKGEKFSGADIQKIAHDAFTLWNIRLNAVFQILAKKEKLPKGVNISPYIKASRMQERELYSQSLKNHPKTAAMTARAHEENLVDMINEGLFAPGEWQKILNVLENHGIINTSRDYGYQTFEKALIPPEHINEIFNAADHGNILSVKEVRHLMMTHHKSRLLELEYMDKSGRITTNLVYISDAAMDSASLKRKINSAATNKAMVYGGIDLSRQGDALHIVKDADGGVVVDVDLGLVARVEREGMSEVDPVIIGMRPADILSLFGVKIL